MKNIKAIAFDLDGTLVDSLEDLAITANAMREFCNLPKQNISILKSYIGDGIVDLVQRSLVDSLNHKINKQLFETGFNYFCQYYFEHLTDNTLAYKHVKECLQLLTNLKISLAVITNKNDIFAKKILKNLNLLNYFSVVIGGNTLPEKKPSATPILYTCKIFDILPEN